MHATRDSARTAPGGAGQLPLECCSKRLEYGEAVSKAGEIDENGDRRSCWSDHGKLALVAPEAVVHLDQRAEPARVDEAHVAEIDYKPESFPVSGVE